VPKSKKSSPSKSELERRLRELEREVASYHGGSGSGGSAGPDQVYCAVPALQPRAMSPDVSSERENLIRYMARKWVNGTILHYYFFDSGPNGGDQTQIDIVREGFDVWADLGLGVTFEEVTNIDQAEVRIGFRRGPGEGYWSYVGTDVLTVGQHERTMNFGYDLTTDRRRENVPVHEIGHTLGFPHEHQNPQAGIVWNEQAVLDYFGGPPNNWDEATTRHNILRKIPQGEVTGSAWDRDSIMHYAFRAGLIDQPVEYRTAPLNPAPGLSDADQEQALLFYPPRGPRLPELRVYESQILELEPAEQADYVINPPATRDYDIRTFGSTDSVMVLFEDQGNGNYVYVDGDDDSGWNRNAHISTRLYHDRTYVLRIRLYYRWASGTMAVMLW